MAGNSHQLRKYHRTKNIVRTMSRQTWLKSSNAKKFADNTNTNDEWLTFVLEIRFVEQINVQDIDRTGIIQIKLEYRKNISLRMEKIPRLRLSIEKKLAILPEFFVLLIRPMSM